MSKINELTIVIPCFNESEGIQQTILRLEIVLKLYTDKYEIIVVDDNSDDGTYKIALSSGVVVLKNQVNGGYGFSLARGIEAATYSTIAIIDADLTYHENDMAMLLEKYRLGYDMCIGIRSGEHLNSSIFKSILRLAYKKIISFVCSETVPDANSGLRIFSKELFNEYKKLLSKKFSFTTSLTICALLGRRQVGWFQISYQPRIGSSKVRLISDSFRTLIQVLQLVAIFNPMKIFLVFATIVLLIAFVSITISLIYKIAAGLLLGAALISVSILIVSLGLTTAVLQKGFERLLMGNNR